ncbi:uncharacterized protein (DUF58 family) [Peribacillus simplex]|uniref:hypothetical protein n=1 Tax=Peribacillus simplex TaxID=1478 RepID=UPI0024E236B4|nr:hypothetical protein [Peribacillus simplex]MDF9759655.1 uncharacterized protein (DUF58 family) [Peribacillus simplex]
MKIPFAILGLSLIPQRWTNAITKKDISFFIEQVLRLLVSAAILFFVIDIMLLDLTATAFFSSFAIILGLILIIDSRMYVYSARESSITRRNRRGNEAEATKNTLECIFQQFDRIRFDISMGHHAVLPHHFCRRSAWLDKGR